MGEREEPLVTEGGAAPVSTCDYHKCVCREEKELNHT